MMADPDAPKARLTRRQLIQHYANPLSLFNQAKKELSPRDRKQVKQQRFLTSIQKETLSRAHIRINYGEAEAKYIVNGPSQATLAQDHARLLQASDVTATNHIITRPPFSSKNVLSNPAWSFSLQRRMGLISFSNTTTQNELPIPNLSCHSCEKTFTDPQSLQIHTDGICNKQKGGPAKNAHDACVKAIAIYVSQSSTITTKIEPRDTIAEGKWQDLALNLNHRTLTGDSKLQRLVTDFTISNPLASTHIKRCLKNPHASLEAAENTKTKKHKSLVEKKGASFVPFALTTFGGLGMQALELLVKLAEHAALDFPTKFNPKSFLLKMIQVMQAQLFKQKYLNWAITWNNASIHAPRLPLLRPMHKKRNIGNVWTLD